MADRYVTSVLAGGRLRLRLTEHTVELGVDLEDVVLGYVGAVVRVT